MNKKRNDAILFGVLIALCILSFLAMLAFRTEGAFVVVRINSEEYARYPLDEDITVKIGEEDYNVLVIKDGYAYVGDANCPDRICVNTGRIRYDGQSVICLPHKLVVEIEGGEATDIDVVVK